jgi:hypothetical protein
VNGPRKPGRLRGLLDRLRRRRRSPVSEDLRPESPPDIGVREPRRPRPSSGSGTAVVEPPETDEQS